MTRFSCVTFESSDYNENDVKIKKKVSSEEEVKT